MNQPHFLSFFFFFFSLSSLVIRSNEDVVLRIASNEVTGGFRKVSEDEVKEDYKNRLKHTKDCVMAYSLPSTLTIIAAASDNVYANPSGEGRWKSIPVCYLIIYI